MGTFVGHLVPGLAFTLLGVWHTTQTIKSYKLKGPSTFTSRPWHPLNSTRFVLKHLELFLLLTSFPLVVALQLLDYPNFHLSFKPNNFEHATMFLHLAIYAAFALAVELTHSPPLFSGLSTLLGSSVFGQELLLLHYHSADHVGLEGHYHWLLQLIVFISLLSSLLALRFPCSFYASLVRSVMIIFQGCFFIDMGFALWVPSLAPRGCYVRLVEDVNGAVACESRDAELRAMALANLQFSWIFAGIVTFTAFFCLRAERTGADAGMVSTEYEKLQSCRNVEVTDHTLTLVDAQSLKQISLSIA